MTSQGHIASDLVDSSVSIFSFLSIMLTFLEVKNIDKVV